MKKEKPKQLTAEDIKVGHWYEAKRFRCLMNGRPNNDRQIVWIGESYVGEKMVQYDSDTVKMGHHLPTIPMETFLKWVAKEITEERHDGRRDLP